MSVLWSWKMGEKKNPIVPPDNAILFNAFFFLINYPSMKRDAGALDAQLHERN